MEITLYIDELTKIEIERIINKYALSITLVHYQKITSSIKTLVEIVVKINSIDNNTFNDLYTLGYVIGKKLK